MRTGGLSTTKDALLMFALAAVATAAEAAQIEAIPREKYDLKLETCHIAVEWKLSSE